MSVNKPSFVVYIDEAGDEGFKFPIKIGERGSSLWFTMSAAVFKSDNEPRQTKVVGIARDALGYQHKRPIHFSDLRHEAKLVVTRHIATADCLVVNVAIYKPEISRDRFQPKGVLYHLASRILMERISWLCRDRLADTARPIGGNGLAQIIFSQRRSFSTSAFSAYLNEIRDGEDDCSIAWNCIDVEGISQMAHGDLDGLQIADVFASALLDAIEPHRLGTTEPRYVKELISRYYDYKGRIRSYGMKTYPSTALDRLRKLDGDLTELFGSK